MSDLVSDQIEKLGTFSNKKLHKERTSTFMNNMRSDPDPDEVEEEEENN
jgi:hypothetical protein